MALAAALDDGGTLPDDGHTPQASPGDYSTPLPGEDEEVQLLALRAQIAALELGSESQEAGESQGDPPTQESAPAQCGVYVLELAGGKFYVGSAHDMGRRIQKHKAKMCVQRAACNGPLEPRAHSRCASQRRAVDATTRVRRHRQHVRRGGARLVQGGARCVVLRRADPLDAPR